MPLCFPHIYTLVGLVQKVGPGGHQKAARVYRDLSLGVDKFAHDPGARGDPHLHHRKPQKNLQSVGADVHAGGDLFARQALHEEANGFLLARRKMVLLADFENVRGNFSTALQQKRQRGSVRRT